MRLFERRQPVIMTDGVQDVVALQALRLDDVLGARLAEPPVVTGGRCVFVVPQSLVA